MNALAIHLYLTIRYINLSFNHFGDFYRIIVNSEGHIQFQSDATFILIEYKEEESDLLFIDGD
ncbi:hypothetical protein EEL34_13280 [Muribaculaceae bacterium Isolate-039 (Harlan)]|nr:hypothetical protein EEL34_13280 [Muribaculaceae bacterium Isolate-039 (Harlan)]